MFRQRILWLSFILLIAPALACNAFAGNGEPTLLPPPTLVGTITAVDGTNTPIDGIVPTATLPGEATITSRAQVTMLVDLNVRGGPGVQYDRVGFLLEGESAFIIGRDANTGWWKIECPGETNGDECWVSGGAQYTTAVNTVGVPVAAIPPTPTPIPPSLNPNQGLLTYIESGRLLGVTLDLSQEPPVAGPTTTLFDGSNGSATNMLISPDGRKVAYVWGARAANNLSVVNIDGSGQRDLMTSADLPLPDDISDVVIQLSQVAWLADSQTLAFNTDIVNVVGPGILSQNDLWTVTLDGTLTEQQRADSGGGFFAIANNHIIVSQANKIGLTTFNDTNVNNLITFDSINTASEYTYYPQPQWTADGNQAYVAVPSQEPFGAEPTVALWRISRTGSAEQLGQLPGNILGDPLIWSANGNVLAYVRYEGNTSTLVVANGNGQDATEYASGSNIRFHSWRANEREFVYSGNGFWAIGQIGTQAIQAALPPNYTVFDAQWITESAFVLALSTGNSWQFYSSTPTGNAELLVELTGNGAQFDVWGP